MPRSLLAALALLIPISLHADDKLPVKRLDVIARDLSLDSLLARLSRDWGIPVARGPDLEANPRLNLQLRGATFWQAVDAAADAAGARVYLFQGDGKILLSRRAESAPPQPVSRDGLFRVALRRISASHDFETNTKNCVATLDLAWEPTFQPFYLETKPRDFVLLDAAGKAVPAPPIGSVWAAIDGRMAMPLELPLPALPRSAQKFSLIKGSFQIRGPARMLTFAFGNLDELSKAPNAPKKQEAGVVCSLTSIKLRSRAWTIQVTAELPMGGPEFESFQFWDVNNQIWLENRKTKQRLAPTGYDRVTTGSRKAVVNYHFEDTPALQRGEAGDWEVVFRCPASIVEVPIPFEFKDVELP